MTDRVQVATVTPAASAEEVAAIVSAIELSWPRPPIGGEGHPAVSRWRFSGRWWSKPLPVRRVRPW